MNWVQTSSDRFGIGLTVHLSYVILLYITPIHVLGDRGPGDYKSEILGIYIQYTSCACLCCLHPFVHSKRTCEHVSIKGGATFDFIFCDPTATTCWPKRRLHHLGPAVSYL